MLDPASPSGVQVADLWWLMFFMGLIVYVVVMGVLLVPLFQQWWIVDQDDEPTDAEPPLGQTPFILLSGAVLPALILTMLLFFALDTQVEMNGPEPELTIRVTGYQWWWGIEYPKYDIVTANQIHIPTGQPVRLELRSADVIHSFWVPRLGGKRDLFPDREVTHRIEAEEAGIYRGQCAEYCGIQHANMAFRVVALPPDEFAAWVEDKQTPPDPSGDLVERGREVFMEAACMDCHRIEGTKAEGEIGPDLTYIGSRLTLGAGTVENTRGNLSGWIVNPQHIKPGNQMPPTHIEPGDLHALVSYLEQLE